MPLNEKLDEGAWLAPSTPANQAPSGRKRQTSLAEEVYLTLKHEIQNLIIPPGQQMEESALVHRFGISRTPVREAIRRLVADELIDLTQHQSARVRPILFEGVRDYFECMRVVQKATFVLGAARIGGAGLAKAENIQNELEAAAKRRDLMAIPNLNNDFHMVIAASASNNYLSDVYERLLVHGTRLAALTLRHYNLTQWAEEMHKISIDHWEIVDAAKEHDQLRMAELSDRHVELFRTQVVGALISEKSDELQGDLSEIATRQLIDTPSSKVLTRE